MSDAERYKYQMMIKLRQKQLERHMETALVLEQEIADLKAKLAELEK